MAMRIWFIGCRVKLANWCLLVVLFISSAIFDVSAQVSTVSLGFVSIDCGIDAGMTYLDPSTNITYVSDADYIASGINKNISSAYVSSNLALRYYNVRSFPNGTRNCYTIDSISPGVKYLIRASFLYGNYDGLGNQTILFDLYLDVNIWTTVNITDPAFPVRAEVITQATADYLSVCLVNTGLGTPFISGLDLRPLKSSVIYPAVNATRSLVLYNRYNCGPTDLFVRYPDDPHDRIWEPFNNIPFWQEISTNSTVKNLDVDYFESPSIVMQTAVIPVNNTKLLLNWLPSPGDINEYFAVMHFSEIQKLTGNMSRQFYLKINGLSWYKDIITPDFLLSDAIYSTNPALPFNQYIVSIEATSNSTLPPLLNAVEIFSRLSNVNQPSDNGDVDTMMEIKNWYKIQKNWQGDPCSPKAYVWDGVNCTSSTSSPTRVTVLNLARNGLKGEITTSFGSLSALQYLDLSYNNLTGTIPSVLGQLPSLKLLDLTGNQLNGSIPSNLIAKSENGVLALRIDGNSITCNNGAACDLIVAKKKKISTAVVAAVCVVAVLVLLLVALLIIWRERKQQKIRYGTSMMPNNMRFKNQNANQDSLHLENRQFTYLELQKITNNFKKILGQGGFGTVYNGRLEDDKEVAVKIRSQSSEQGIREFLAEAKHLTRVHHRNLVSMIGYCKDGDYLGLVYEFMSKGTLQDHIRGRNANVRSLTWKERLHIALQSAEGLEYLHKGCKPPLIHRDVKTANILLSETLEAKLADFGLSKPFELGIVTHISTTVVGTPGYLDPEYHATFQLSEKSDVYSFGVVLLELITGQPAIISSENANIVHWVRQRLSQGNIEDVVDVRLNGEFDINSVWKCADVALKCTAQYSYQRPTMSDVIMQLKESLELEATRGGTGGSQNLFSAVSEISLDSAAEIENIAGMSVVTGPSAR